MAMDGDMGIDNLLHVPADAHHVFVGHLTADTEIAVVTVGNRDINGHLGFLVKVVYGLAKHKEERARIGPCSRRTVHIKKLNGFLVIDAIMQSLHLVVHFGTDGTIRHIKV